jgi:hypothetical protein
MLAVERFGRTVPERIEIVRLKFQRSPKQTSREDFCDQLRRILAESFPDETVEKISIAADLEHSISGVYARGVSRRGSVRGAFLTVPASETQDVIENSVTFALLWLERAKQSAGKETVSFLRLIVPEGKVALLVHQLSALDPRLMLEIYELNSLNEHLERIDPRANGNVTSWLVPRRESELLLNRAKRDPARIISMAPEAIDTHAVPAEQEVILRFRGLPFARWKDGLMYFGNGAVWKELNGSSEAELKQLIQKLKTFRRPLANNLRHLF